MLPDVATFASRGMSRTSRTPGVNCGAELPRDAIEVPEPVIVVEVAPPSMRKIDASLKLSGYFSLPASSTT